MFSLSPQKKDDSASQSSEKSTATGSRLFNTGGLFSSESKSDQTAYSPVKTIDDKLSKPKGLLSSLANSVQAHSMEANEKISPKKFKEPSSTSEPNSFQDISLVSMRESLLIDLSSSIFNSKLSAGQSLSSKQDNNARSSISDPLTSSVPSKINVPSSTILKGHLIYHTNSKGDAWKCYSLKEEKQISFSVQGQPPAVEIGVIMCLKSDDEAVVISKHGGKQKTFDEVYTLRFIDSGAGKYSLKYKK